MPRLSAGPVAVLVAAPLAVLATALGAPALPVVCGLALVAATAAAGTLAARPGAGRELTAALAQRDELADALARAHAERLETAARASEDLLTGLPNRAALRESLERMTAHAGRSVTPLAAILVDLDHFGAVAALAGPEAADGALRAVATVVRGTTRSADVVGRWDDDAFLVLAPGTDALGAGALADNLLADLSRLAVVGVDEGLTASLGVSAYPEHAGDAAGLIARAEAATSAAKDRGRNRVELADTVPEA